MSDHQRADEMERAGDRVLGALAGLADGEVLSVLAGALGCVIASFEDPEAAKTAAIRIIDGVLSGVLLEPSA